MRIWSISPAYLDTKGLLAAWREGLLAQKVLRGGTRGYRNHPQLLRFKASPEPLSALGSYLWALYRESRSRGYRFEAAKILTSPGIAQPRLAVTTGQIVYEFDLLRAKVKTRDEAKWRELAEVERPEPNAAFFEVPGSIESWERVREF